MGGDFDGDVFQVMPVTPYKPLDEIKNPNHDWSDLAPLVDQVRREGWGEQGTTPKVKRRLATHVAPESPDKVTEKNRRWLASAAISQGGHRDRFLVELGHYLDTQSLEPEKKQELAAALSAIVRDRERSVDEAVDIAEAHGFDSHGWISDRESDPSGRASGRACSVWPGVKPGETGRQALKIWTAPWARSSTRLAGHASLRHAVERKRIPAACRGAAAEVTIQVRHRRGHGVWNAVRKKLGRSCMGGCHKDPSTFVRDLPLATARMPVPCPVITTSAASSSWDGRWSHESFQDMCGRVQRGAVSRGRSR